MALAEQEQDEAARKIQNCARSKRSRKRANKRRNAKRRLEEMKAEGKEWTAEEQGAATKLQTRQRMKRDKMRVKQISDSRKREAEMTGREWTQDEQAAATKLQTRQRMARDKQRVQDIKEGKRGAFECVVVYTSGSVKVVFTTQDSKENSGTFKVAKGSSEFFCSGTFKQSGVSVILTPEGDLYGPLVIDVDESMSFAVQGTENWMTSA